MSLKLKEKTFFKVNIFSSKNDSVGYTNLPVNDNTTLGRYLGIKQLLMVKHWLISNPL